MSQSAASHQTNTSSATNTSTATSAAPSAPADLKPTATWSYPFALAKGNASDPQAYLEALSQAEGGFYPLGTNGVWHGGIHFDGGTESSFKQVTGIACPADCEVVAYRLDSKYPELAYPDGKKALYSSGFVLARFKLALPPVPAAKKPAASPGPGATQPPAHGATSANAASATQPNASSAPAASATTPAVQPADEIQTFYVLYMHLLDWAGYQSAEQQLARASNGSDGKAATVSIVQRPHFWKGKQHFRVGSKAPNQQARPELNQADQAIASDPLGALVGTFEQPEDQQKQSQANVFKVANATSAKSVGGARIRSEGSSAGHILGLLPSGGEVILGTPNAKGWAQITSIEKGTPVGPIAGQDPLQGAEQGWMYSKELESLIDPDALDSVVVVDPPYQMKAGTVIGYLGEYTRHQDSSALPPEPAHPIVHMEIFADDSFLAFLDKSRDRAKALPDSDKNVLVIAKGAKLVPDPGAPTESIAAKTTVKETSKSPKAGRWVQVQPMKALAPTPGAKSSSHKKSGHSAHSALQPDGDPLWIERSKLAAISKDGGQAWKEFPLNLSKAANGPTGFQYAIERASLDQESEDSRASDDQGVHWWKVICGAESGGAVTGWVCEKSHPQTSWQSAWAWPGFEKVDATPVTVVDSFKRFLSITGAALPEDKQSFKATATSVNSSDLIVKIEQAVSAQGDKDGTVTALDICRALRQPWLAQAISRLIVKYESEWGGGMDKWNSLTPIMKTVDAKGRWQAEMERIKKLQWWDQAKSGIKGFPASPSVHHFHPIGLIGNFVASAGKIAWGAKVSSEFKQKVIAICQELELNPSYLMSAMAFETGESFRADIPNAAGSGAVGLIQFMPSTAIALGTTTAELSKMTNVEQLDYVKKYFTPRKGQLHTLEDVYCMIFYPAAIGQPDDYVVAHKTKINKEGKEVNDPVYSQNAGFDTDNVGYITKYQISSKIRDKYNKGMGSGYFG